jgi:hypothetical protein
MPILRIRVSRHVLKEMKRVARDLRFKDPEDLAYFVMRRHYDRVNPVPERYYIADPKGTPTHQNPYEQRR